MASSENLLLSSFILQAITFTILNLLKLLLYLLKDKCMLFKRLHYQLSRVCVWWMLPIMILKPNIKSLTFNIFLQMNPLMLGYYAYKNKLNFCVACVVLFAIVLYSFAFYLVIFSLAKKSYSQILLNFTKFKASSFFLESFTRITRDLLNAFFQSYFIFDYRKLIICLMSIQILHVLFAICFRKNYVNHFIFIFWILYYIFFFLFNVTLVI